MEQAAPQPVMDQHHQDIEQSPYRVLEHRIECWTLIPRPLAMDVMPYGRCWPRRLAGITSATADPYLGPEH